MGPSVADMAKDDLPASASKRVPPGCRRGARGPGAATAAFRTLRRSLARSHRDAALLARGGAPLTSTRDDGPRFGVNGLFSGLTLKRTRRLGFMLGELVQTTDGKWITRPPSRCPNGHTLGANQVPRRACRMPGARRRWAHQLALPHLRCRGLRTNIGEALHTALEGPAAVRISTSQASPR